MKKNQSGGVGMWWKQTNLAMMVILASLKNNNDSMTLVEGSFESYDQHECIQIEKIIIFIFGGVLKF